MTRAQYCARHCVACSSKASFSSYLRGLLARLMEVPRPLLVLCRLATEFLQRPRIAPEVDSFLNVQRKHVWTSPSGSKCHVEGSKGLGQAIDHVATCLQPGLGLCPFFGNQRACIQKKGWALHSPQNSEVARFTPTEHAKQVQHRSPDDSRKEGSLSRKLPRVRRTEGRGNLRVNRTASFGSARTIMHLPDMRLCLALGGPTKIVAFRVPLKPATKGYPQKDTPLRITSTFQLG